jgi:FkbM family methyltransferase
MIKRAVRQAFRSLGYDISRYDPRLSPSEALARLFATYGVDAVFDVGANVGNYVRELRSGGFAGRVVSFEPREAAHAVLVERADRDPAWVIAPAMALGSAAGEAEINVAGNSASSSLREMTGLHQKAAPESKYVGKEKIEVQRLDSVFGQYVGGATKPFLKIDTQGYELEVLEGARACLHRFVGIQAELSLRELYGGQTLWLDFARRLEREGFQLANLFPVFSDDSTGELLQFDGVFFRRPTP